MAKSKLPGKVKERITKLYKSGKDVDEIKAVVIEKFPKITADRIRTVIRVLLYKLCDDLWSEAVKVAAGGKCAVSGKTTGLNSHHLIGRDNTNYRWVVKNGVCLAADHHTLGNPIAAHGSTDVTQRFAEWMEEYRPGQWAWFQYFKDNKTPYPVKIENLLQISKRLESEIEAFKKQPKPDILARKEQ